MRRLKTMIGPTALATAFGALIFSATGLADTALYTRQDNQTIRMPVRLEASGTHYGLENLLPGLVLTNPVMVTSIPGETNRLFIVERAGRVLVVTNWANPTRVVFLDISSRVNSDYAKMGAEGLTAMAFHPSYRDDGHFFVSYSTLQTTETGTLNYIRLSRFTVSKDNPNRADPDSELLMISQLDEGYGHNMNDLKFGNDGYLYVAIGDEGESHDRFQNSYRIDKDFFSAILRLDVNKARGNLLPNSHPAVGAGYLVPADNPFVGVTQFNNSPVDPAKVRTEFYAIGFRNPWRMSFDPVTGALLCGDVGQHAMEEVNKVVKGGNYGWAFKEGTRAGFRGDPPSGYEWIPPLIEYEHGYGPTQGNTVVGGVFPQSTNSSSGLVGSYVFGDFVSGNIWATSLDGDGASEPRWLTSDPGIAAFGVDPRNGDVLAVDHDEGKIKRLREFQPGEIPVPALLSDTGVFTDTTSLAPAPGVIPYDVNAPFWSDRAEKQRWFSVLSASDQMTFDPDGPWQFPSGTIWVKQFNLPITNGVPASAKRVETRLLVHDGQKAYGLTYRWNEEGTDASLVPAEGLDVPFTIHDNGITRTQIWHYPSRNECLSCHTAVAGYALGFNTAQLNRPFNYGSVITNQLGFLSRANYFRNPVTNLHSLPALAHPTNTVVSREYRVRSYLAANCAHCHQPGGPGSGMWDARITTPLSQAGIIDGQLVGSWQNPDTRVIKPGVLDLSMMYKRMATLGPDRMPPIGSTERDETAIELMKAWILEDLPARETFEEWQVRFFESPNSPNASPTADPDGDGAPNQFEFLTGTDPENREDAWRLEVMPDGDAVLLMHPGLANRAVVLEAAAQVGNPAWHPLNRPDNAPRYFATNSPVQLRDPISGSPNKFYRARIVEP